MTETMRVRIGSAWLAALAFLYPIPHTIALRNLLLATGIFALATVYRPDWRDFPRRYGWLKPAAGLLAALTVWIMLQSTFISPFRERALGLIWGGWVMPIIAAAAGFLAASQLPRRSALTAVTLALATHIGLVVIWQAWLMLSIGTVPPQSVVPFAERDYQSLINNFLLALLLADRICRHGGAGAVLLFPSSVAWALLAMPILADPLLRTRNGTLVTLLLTGVALALLLRRTRQRHSARLILSGAFVLAALAATTVALDERWMGLVESMQIGWQSDSLYWMDSRMPLPTTSSGTPLEESAYMRSAWARQALEGIASHPLGLGFGHQAFGWAIELKYGFRGMESSHSGWMDFALANGIPGLAMWLALSIWLVSAGWRGFALASNGVGLFLTFVVLSYLLRCLFDGHLSGWRLTLFALLVGTSLATASKAARTDSRHNG